MLQNLRYSLISLARNPPLLFWPLAFPIVLALTFSAMFSNIAGSYDLAPLTVGVVRDANYDAAPGLDETLAAVDDASDTVHVLDLTTYSDVDAAEAAVLDGDQQGYITVDADGVPELHLSTAVDLTEGTTTQVSVSCANSVLNGYVCMRHELEDVAEADPTLLSDPATIGSFVTDNVSTELTKVTRNDPDPSVRYYYALLGMACGLGAVIGLEAIRRTQPVNCMLGARRTVCGMPRWKVLVSTLAAAWIVSFACMLVAFAFIRLVIGVDFGGRDGLALVCVAVSTLVSTSAGALTATIGAGPMSSGILTALTTLLSFFAGLYGTACQRISDQIANTFPALAAINPIREIAQSFYSLLYYDSLEPFATHCLALAAMAAVLVALAALRMRRVSHAHL